MMRSNFLTNDNKVDYLLYFDELNIDSKIFADKVLYISSESGNELTLNRKRNYEKTPFFDFFKLKNSLLNNS